MCNCTTKTHDKKKTDFVQQSNLKKHDFHAIASIKMQQLQVSWMFDWIGPRVLFEQQLTQQILFILFFLLFNFFSTTTTTTTDFELDSRREELYDHISGSNWFSLTIYEKQTVDTKQQKDEVDRQKRPTNNVRQRGGGESMTFFGASIL